MRFLYGFNPIHWPLSSGKEIGWVFLREIAVAGENLPLSSGLLENFFAGKDSRPIA